MKLPSINLQHDEMTTRWNSRRWIYHTMKLPRWYFRRWNYHNYMFTVYHSMKIPNMKLPTMKLLTLKITDDEITVDEFTSQWNDHTMILPTMKLPGWYFRRWNYHDDFTVYHSMKIPTMKWPHDGITDDEFNYYHSPQSPLYLWVLGRRSRISEKRSENIFITTVCIMHSNQPRHPKYSWNKVKMTE